jgi:glycosyltransferase involved in cell wall biosynthesis
VARDYARKDSRVIVHRNPANLGMVRNRNACLRLARGEYVKFIHADDYLNSPEVLRRMVAQFELHPALSLVACATQSVDVQSRPTGRSPHYFAGRRLFAGTSVITRCLLEDKNLMGGPSAALFRRSQALRGFDERYFHAADLEMWFHLLEQGCFAFIDEPLVAYRWHPRQQTEKDRSTLSHVTDHRALNAAYLWKPYVHLRRRLKEHLEHDNVRQTRRQCRKLGLRDQAAEALKDYGVRRYLTNYPWSVYWRRAAKRSRAVIDRELPLALGAPQDNHKSPRPPGLNVAGFFKGQYGIGESSRAFCRAAAESGVPYALVNIHSNDHSNRDASIGELSEHNPYAVNLMTFTFDFARRFYRDRGRAFFEGRHNIALWYWELQQFPLRWRTNFDYYDEIWVPSDFCLKALAEYAPIPVHKMTYPLYPLPDSPGRRSPFRLKESSFVFLFTFDYFSTLERKNPIGLLRAFRRAFDPAEDVVLVLKSINGRHDAPGRELLHRAAEGLKVRFMDAHFPNAQLADLFAAADAYVSLHRSEGLGLGMAQAMALGKPVIGTHYSGNLEYMNPENSLLVRHDLVELREDYGPRSMPAIYEKGHVWAEPDIEDAARHMRWVVDHRDEAARMGARGREAVRAILDPARTRIHIKARVEAAYSRPTER